MKKTVDWIANITTCIGAMLGVIMVCSCVLCVFTPQKTKYNMYTDVYRYWFDNTYFCSNFDCPEKGV